MANTTKQVKPIATLQRFNQTTDNNINSITLKGKTSLADLSIDKNGDVILYLRGDKSKIDTIITDKFLKASVKDNELTLSLNIDTLIEELSKRYTETETETSQPTETNQPTETSQPTETE